MTYQNSLDKSGKCKTINKNSIKKFIEITKANGIKVKKSSKEEDIKNHIDYWIEKNGKVYSIDIKGIKSNNRKSDDPDYKWIWIEYKNTQGNKGWLYGDQDLIGFEQNDSFLIVNREELRALCEKIAPFEVSNIVTTPEEAKRKIYSRNGRLDILTRIHIDDILDNIKSWEWKNG
jgi:hypothetical protein